MTSTLKLENPYARSNGQIGARATLRIDHPTRPQSFSFDTHGMTSQQVVDEAARIENYHAAKVSRLDIFRRLHGFVVNHGGIDFTIVDCTILDAGVTLYVDVRPPAKRFPLRIACHAIENIPTNDAILKMVTEALPDSSGIASAHAEFVAKVEARRG
jgi:hypothetical protein